LQLSGLWVSRPGRLAGLSSRRWRYTESWPEAQTCSGHRGFSCGRSITHTRWSILEAVPDDTACCKKCNVVLELATSLTHSSLSANAWFRTRARRQVCSVCQSWRSYRGVKPGQHAPCLLQCAKHQAGLMSDQNLNPRANSKAGKITWGSPRARFQGRQTYTLFGDTWYHQQGDKQSFSSPTQT